MSMRSSNNAVIEYPKCDTFRDVVTTTIETVGTRSVTDAHNCIKLHSSLRSTSMTPNSLPTRRRKERSITGSFRWARPLHSRHLPSRTSQTSGGCYRRRRICRHHPTINPSVWSDQKEEYANDKNTRKLNVPIGANLHFTYYVDSWCSVYFQIIT